MDFLQYKKDSLFRKQIIELEKDNDVCNKQYNKLGQQNLKLNNINKILIGSNSISLLLLIVLLL